MIKFLFKKFFFVFFVFCFSVIFYLFFNLPKIDKLKNYNPSQKSVLYDKSGKIIAEFFVEKRTVIEISKLPNYIINAFLSAEDSEFYLHSGINYRSFAIASLNEIKRIFLGGRKIGGSTITQQTIKAVLLSNKRSYTRKIKELILTKKVENSLSKGEILHVYLNHIYFGNGVYGIEEASQLYYGVSAFLLTVSQAATLASIPQSPKINPISDPNRVYYRRNYILDRMKIDNFISLFEANSAKKDNVVFSVEKNRYLNKASYFAETIRKKIIKKFGYNKLYTGGLKIYSSIDINLQLLAEKAIKKGLEAVDKRRGYSGPFRRFKDNEYKNITTKLNIFKKRIFYISKKNSMIWDLRKLIVSKNIKQFMKTIDQVPLVAGKRVVALVKEIYDNSKSVLIDLGSTDALLPLYGMKWVFNVYKNQILKKPSDLFMVGDFVEVIIKNVSTKIIVYLTQKPTVQGSLVAINTNNNDVVAMVGGYDFLDSKFNRATQAKRQPGSSIKPFIYAIAIDSELVTAASLISDVPKVYVNSKHMSKWKPKNHTKKYLGDITLRRCLLSSVNTCSISLLEMIGVETILNFATSLNLNTKSSPFPKDLTLALGSPDVVPLNFINAFTIFPNMGIFSPPILIKQIKELNGKILFQNKINRKQVLRPESAYIIINILKDYMHKVLGKNFSDMKYNLAGKTGTSNNWRNAWFVGFSPELVVGVYVGNDDNTSLGKFEYGLKAAMPIWNNFMKKVIKSKNIKFNEPDGLVWRVVDENTGLLSEEIFKKNYVLYNLDINNLKLPNGTILEAFIEGTEPTLTVKESPLPPIELFELRNF